MLRTVCLAGRQLVCRNIVCGRRSISVPSCLVYMSLIAQFLKHLKFYSSDKQSFKAVLLYFSVR